MMAAKPHRGTGRNPASSTSLHDLRHRACSCRDPRRDPRHRRPRRRARSATARRWHGSAGRSTSSTCSTGRMPRALQALRALQGGGRSRSRSCAFRHPMGEAAALSVGFRHAAGDVVMTLHGRAAGRAPPTCRRAAWRRWTAPTSWWRAAASVREPPRRRKLDQRGQRACSAPRSATSARRPGDARRGRQRADALRQPAPLPAAAGPGAGLPRDRDRPRQRSAPASGAASLLGARPEPAARRDHRLLPAALPAGSRSASSAASASPCWRSAACSPPGWSSPGCSSACRWSTGRRWC